MAKKTKAKKTPDGRTVIARNRRARHEYHLEEEVECGIELRGSEVKSLRAKVASLEQAYARITDGQVYLLGANFPAYEAASYNNHEPKRTRRLLLHRRQIEALERALRDPGRTLVPLELYFNAEGRAKLLLALATGKKAHDKRQTLAEKDAKREMDRAMKRDY